MSYVFEGRKQLKEAIVAPDLCSTVRWAFNSRGRSRIQPSRCQNLIADIWNIFQTIGQKHWVNLIHRSFLSRQWESTLIRSFRVVENSRWIQFWPWIKEHDCWVIRCLYWCCICCYVYRMLECSRLLSFLIALDTLQFLTKLGNVDVIRQIKEAKLGDWRAASDRGRL